MASQPDRLADRHRLAQVAIRAATVRSLLVLWDALIDPTDLDGTIVILSMRASVDASAAAHAELAAVLDSVSIDPT